jgi:hypothetical protein
MPLKLIRLLSIFFILLLACQTEDEPSFEMDPDLLEVQNLIVNAEERFIDPSARVSCDVTICGDSIEYPLMWYLSRDIGHIRVSNSSEYLIVDMKLDTGFFLQKTDVIIKEKKECNTEYYIYNYPVVHEDSILDYTYFIPISDLKSAPDHIILSVSLMAWKENQFKPGKMINALAKDVSLESERYLIKYYFQKCDPET